MGNVSKESFRSCSKFIRKGGMPFIEWRKGGEVGVVENVCGKEMRCCSHGTCAKKSALGLSVVNACGKATGLVGEVESCFVKESGGKGNTASRLSEVAEAEGEFGIGDAMWGGEEEESLRQVGSIRWREKREWGRSVCRGKYEGFVERELNSELNALSRKFLNVPTEVLVR